MLALSPRAEQRFLDIVCLLVGTIMAYRGAIDFFLYEDSPWRSLLGLIFLGGVISIYLMHRRRKIGFWLFVFFDFSVGLVFIFALEDIWYHHVWPHIVYALAFVPFYRRMHWGPPPLAGTETLDPPEPVQSFFGWLGGKLVGLVDRMPWLARLIERWPAAQRFVNRRIIDGITSSPPHRPLPRSLWTPDDNIVPRDPANRQQSYVSWPGLVDRAFTGRHLPPMADGDVAALPDIANVAALFQRGEFKSSNKTTALFCFFAQWFTDSFLRSHPKDARRNTSNHEIDLCQIYGLGEETTGMLRSGSDGLLCHRAGPRFAGATGDPIYPALLADPETKLVKEKFAWISFDPIHATSFGVPDPPHGIARDLRGLLTAIGPWAATDDRWLNIYAAGLERANSTILYSAFNTIFLREHNRLARQLAEQYPSLKGDDDRLFEFARNISIVQLLKIIIEDYINHLASSPFKLRLEQGFADRCRWYRTNRIALEFNLLYRWHAMVPDTFALGGHTLTDQEFRFNNALLEEHGVEAVIDAASRQQAGQLVLHNTPHFLFKAEQGSLAFARQFRLMPFNAYRRSWQLPSYRSIEHLTGGAPQLTRELHQLYPDHSGVPGIERVELPVGLLAEQRTSNQVLPGLLRNMVASDAFSQALTNPLLAAHVFGADCFTDYGLEQIEGVHGLNDIVRRNLTPGAVAPLVTFTSPGAPESALF